MYFKATLAFFCVMAASLTAQAEPCAANKFTNRIGKIYLDAEHAVFVKKAPERSLEILSKALKQPINCYEENALLKLSAYAKIEAGDRKGAISDLMAGFSKGYVREEQRRQTLINIAHLFLQDGNEEQALFHLELATDYPTRISRDDAFALANIHTQLGDAPSAIGWAEHVMTEDGLSPQRPVIDLLAYLYTSTGETDKLDQLAEAYVLSLGPREDSLFWADIPLETRPVIRTPLSPEFPKEAAERAISGKCDVRFGLRADGTTHNVHSICTDPVFKRASEVAAEQLEFEPNAPDGSSVEGRKLVYPIEFIIQN